MFKEPKAHSFGEREEEILQFWKDEKIFEKVVEARKEAPHFSSYDGPPFATGLPHYGHFLAGTIKDVVLRYQTMKGFSVPRRNGWDCHGLPIENEVEKANAISGGDQIEQYGIAQFNEDCRQIVLRYTDEWKEQMERMGRWVDFSNTWKTMDLSFMESVWWVFKQLYDKGLVYKGYKVMPYSWKLGTPLSNFEAGENYKDVDDPSLTVAFTLKDAEDTSLLIWTTTPWTLVSNLAILVGEGIDYVKILDPQSGKKYVLAKERVAVYFEHFELIETFKGKELIGKEYLPLFDYFKEHKKSFRILPEDGVSTEEGTGLVHAAPAFGEVDFFACQKGGIELVCPVDRNGKFTDEIPEYQGMFVKDADRLIIKRLKEMGRVFSHTTCHHRYPFCWRSDTPLIYRAVSTWFVAVEKIKEQLVQNNQKVHWTPAHLKDGRFGKWLEGARDWAISRNRYWGTPIPLWESDDGEIIAIGSVEELEKMSGKKVSDLHRHFIDDYLIEKEGKIYRRIPEVFDCWFESGSMPYAQSHYPFENKEDVEKHFPADFIAEGLDQTRGWFYTLMILSTALFDQPAFKNVIVNGIILAEDGAKMSKRLKNYPDPMKVVSQYGADAVRLYMMHSGAVRSDDLRFCEKGVELVLRQILLPLWNAYVFFVTYARIYHWSPSTLNKNPKAAIDQWILSLTERLIEEVGQGLDAYDLSSAVEPLVGFVDQLTNWYIRRSRRRFWAEEESEDRNDAFSTLYQVLLTFVKVASPFIPFISEAMYQNLKSASDDASVHLTFFPKETAEKRLPHLETVMVLVQKAVSLGHALRKMHKLKVRQPLAVAYIATSNRETLAFLEEQAQLIKDELNVKKIEFTTDETQFVQMSAKPNFRALGKRVGHKMREVQELIAKFSKGELDLLEHEGKITIELDGAPFLLNLEEVEISRSVAPGEVALNEGEMTIVLETALTEPLLLEGIAREIVNKVNTMRRVADFNVSDRIVLKMDTTDRVRQAYRQHANYIQSEILAKEVCFESCKGEHLDLNGEGAVIEIIRVAPNSIHHLG